MINPFSLTYIFLKKMTDYYSQFFDDDDEETFVFMTAYHNSIALSLQMEDEEDVQEQRRVSQKKRREITAGDRLLEEKIFINDYFIDIIDEFITPRFNEVKFRRRFRMQRSLFLRISEDLENNGKYFQQRADATGLMGYSSWRKCTAALRQLAYGVSSDILEESIRIGASTSLKCVKQFCEEIVELYEEEYLRTPTEEDLRRILSINEKRGFPGMIGSIDCMHWEWKNCPTAWHGQFTGKEKKPTVVLEAVATQDLWIWHSYFGLPGSLNDINIVDRSPVFNALLEGHIPDVNFTVNGHDYNKPYYLGDGIYPEWAGFVKSIRNPANSIEKVVKK